MGMIRGVDHINIATTDLESTRAFFVDVLGLTQGRRPPFEAAGYWLYADGRPIVHMQETPDRVCGSYLSALNHAAFRVADLDGLLTRLRHHGVHYHLTTVPGTEVRQAFFSDPNGVRLELTEAG
jgi:catechol 2,3-dioxygenase-like lactoylglutathione lyase family enzyme